MQPSPTGPIPRGVLLRDPDRSGPVPSPDGTLLFYAALHEGALTVWVQELAGLDASGPARPVTATRHGIAEFTACTDRRLVYTENTSDGDACRLYVLDLDTGTARLVVSGGEVRIVGYSPSCDPERLLLTHRCGEQGPHDVWALDLATGQMAEVASNPGHDGGPLFGTWLVDPALRVFGGVSSTPDGGTVIHRRTGPDGPYEPLIHIPGEHLDPSAALQLAWDEALFTTTSLGAATLRLVRIDTVTGDLTVISGDPDADVVDVWWDPASLRPVVAAYGPGQPELCVLDPTWATDVEALQELVGAGVALRLVSADSLGTLLLIEATAPDAPARYYLYNAKTGQGRYLFCDRDTLAGYRLAPTMPVSITGDGWELRCHLTRPVEAPDGPLPAVLQIHNGHRTRDHWRFDPETQWLASRGYAVIAAHIPAQPLGHDTVDAVAELTHILIAHFAAESVIDPDRVGLYGGSRDGYAAFCGAAGEQGFRCVVSACSPAHITAMLTIQLRTDQNEADWTRRRAQLAHTGRTGALMLMAEGINLPGAIVQLDALAADLRRDGVPVHLIDFGSEGRGLVVLCHTRATFLTVTEAIFAAYLGGIYEPATAARPARPLQE
jgi:dipeptidyl aminopeptidase/acylaminoacyl peptidase